MMSYLSNEDIEQQIHWLQLILGFYKIKDRLYYSIVWELSDLARAKKDYEAAISYLKETLKGIDDDLAKDYILSHIDQNYLDMGLSYFHTGEIDQAINILESLIASAEYRANPQIKTLTAFHLGEIYYLQKDYFKAAEYIYFALATEFRYVPEYLTKSEIAQLLPKFRASIDTVQSENPADCRTHIWAFVYYLYDDNIEIAMEHFKQHLAMAGQYEADFTNYVIRLMNKQKLATSSSL